MQVMEIRGDSALCLYRGQQTLIDTMLVGEAAPGTWLLVFLQTAREIISSERAKQINDALEAMRLAMQGETDLDHLFPDLANRQPELPEFLR
jgi:hydrogenase expression/formation protein HypC